MNENHKNHKLMWNELARTGGGDKEMAAEKLSLPRAKFYCYACESTMAGGYMENCKNCPIKWSYNSSGYHSCTENDSSPYVGWINAKHIEPRKKYAKIIANMKWRTKK